MNNRLNKLMATLAGVAILAAGVALPTSGAFAQTVTGAAGITAGIGVTVTTSSTGARSGGNNLATLISKAQTRADQEITRRITALNALNTRVNSMTKIASSSQASLSASIQTQITAMNTLQAQIASDAAANSTSSLKTDIQSITKSYRIFALIIPQGAIEAAADRVLDVSGMMTSLTTQLQTRITTAQNAGNDMSAETSALADMNTQIANANTSANAAVSEVSGLQPDNGNTTIQASNTAALKDARTKIQTAQQDLTAARKDAGTIVKDLTALKGSGMDASTTVSASATVQ